MGTAAAGALLGIALTLVFQRNLLRRRQHSVTGYGAEADDIHLLTS